MNKLKIKDFLWSTIGSVIFGFISLFFMIIVTRINGIEMAGVFTYAFANACVFCAIGSYSGKTFQITESNEHISDSDYLYHKLTTCFIMNIVAVLFCLITLPGVLKGVMIVILTLFRSIDAIIDSIHAIVQRNGELYKVGQSMLTRTITLIITFLIIDKICNSIILSSLAVLIVNIVFLVFIDFPKIKGKYKKSKFDKLKNKMLLKVGFVVFLYSFLSVYLLNASKYAINNYNSDEVQAIFGIIIMPASFLALVSQYLIQPFLNNITDNVKKKNKEGLIKNLTQIGLFIVLVGLLALIVCYFIGIPILELVYGISLDNQLWCLLIILLGSIFHSLVILISSIFIALRKTFTQLIVLIFTSIFALIFSKLLTYYYGILGASIAYTLTTFLELLLHSITLFFILRFKERVISIRLMGGLGNQMFQYAALRTMMLKYNLKGNISLKGITNITHNVYCLNHFNISKEVQVINSETFKSKINYLLYGFYCLFLMKRKCGFKVIKKVQPILNSLGMYCVPDGYVNLSNSYCNNNVMVGYYQSLKYFDEYKDIIKDELKVTDEVLEKNKVLLKEIKNNNSVCIHIRRGDYVGTKHQVCDENYYLKAAEIINKKVKNAKLYIFSDDLEWVKENIKFKDKVYYVEGNNNYEDLRLMYSCKHFIISNSSFSWWAQYLTDNKKRITIAPQKWFQNGNQKVDIFENDWIKI